jgi:hypothetical protein
MSASPKQWKDQGCPACRASWEASSKVDLRHIGTSNELHTRLYQCRVCSSYWQELERYAHEIPADEARALEQNKSFIRIT